MATAAPAIDTVRQTELSKKFKNLEVALNSDLVERQHEIKTALNALLSRKHHFQVGPPGVAKSLLVTRLIAYIDGFPDDGYFKWLLTKYTTPEEVFGPPSLKALENDEYRRNTAHKMPPSLLTFLDEIFKANSSILNALLTIMNEREFANNDGGDSQVPLMTVFSASNEMPMGDELNALWDRIHFRHEVRPVQDGGNFVKMLVHKLDPDPEPIISIDEIQEAQAQVDDVLLPSDIYDQVKILRDALKKVGIEPTERRWMECLPIIRASAWLENRPVAEIDDMKILRFVLWPRTDSIKVVADEVLQLANPIERAANDLLLEVESLGAQLDEAIQNADNPKSLAKTAVEIHGKLQKAKKEKETLKAEAQKSGRPSEGLAELDDRFLQIGSTLMKECFNVDAPPPEVANG